MLEVGRCLMDAEQRRPAAGLVVCLVFYGRFGRGQTLVFAAALLSFLNYETPLYGHYGHYGH